MMQTYFITGGADLILPLTDDHMFEDKLQETIYKLNKTEGNKTESPSQKKLQMTISGAGPGRAKICVNGKITENAPLSIKNKVIPVLN
jgi:homoserine kinase